MEINIEKEFELFKKEHGLNSYLKLSLFLNSFRKKYQEYKIKIYLDKGFNYEEAQNKSRQSWVAFLGRQLENIILMFLKDFCNEIGAKVIKGEILKKEISDFELSLVRRKILVHFGPYSLIPDADLVVYKIFKNDIQIIAILSIKNSFRERYTETPFWKIKLMQDEITRPIKVFMVTPDNDNEISFINKGRPSKARIVMEYELDSIYLAKEKFDRSEKVKSLSELLNDLKILVKETF